jgi:hypothetical protein
MIHHRIICFLLLCMLLIALLSPDKSHNPTPPQPEGGLTPPKPTYRCETGALSWLAHRQAADGGWSFTDGFTDKSRAAARTEATAWVLLALLEAGQSQNDGRYRETVAKGLNFLLEQQPQSSNGDDFSGKADDLFACALATQAISAARRSAADRALDEPIRRAVDRIVARQDVSTGGWSLNPGEPAHLAATYRQLAALHEASHALPDLAQGYGKVLKKAEKFLDSVYSRESGGYGYTKPDNNPTATAMACICRMEMGVPDEDPRLKRGIELLARLGPSQDDAAMNFYAFQALFGWRSQGEGTDEQAWYTWNRSLRTQLVKSYIEESGERGSWPAGPGHTLADDPMYRTAFNTLTMLLAHVRRGRGFDVYVKRAHVFE